MVAVWRAWPLDTFIGTHRRHSTLITSSPSPRNSGSPRMILPYRNSTSSLRIAGLHAATISHCSPHIVDRCGLIHTPLIRATRARRSRRRSTCSEPTGSSASVTCVQHSSSVTPRHVTFNTAAQEVQLHAPFRLLTLLRSRARPAAADLNGWRQARYATPRVRAVPRVEGRGGLTFADSPRGKFFSFIHVFSCG